MTLITNFQDFMTDNGKTRQLAAIMFVDMVGYTALMQSDEAQAMEKRNRHRSALKKYVDQHHGSILQFFGDGALCIFSSAVESVRAAASLQKDMQTAPSIPCRIGIHLGDIVYDDEGAYGDGVNLASRIESLSVPGAIFVSSKINDELKNHSIDTRSMGVYELKNVVRPVEVFAVEADHLIIPKRSSIQGKGRRIKKSFVRRAAILFLGLLGAFGGYSLYNTFSGSGDKSFTEDRFAVQIFDNYTFKPEYDAIGKMAADWVTQGLIETGLAKVVSFNSMGRFQKLLDENPSASIKEITGAENFLSGQYTIEDDQLVIQGFIKNAETDAVLENSSMMIRCPIDNPLQGIQELKQKILGYWVSKDEQLTSPPSYDAYLEYLQAKEKYNLDWTQALEHIDRALEKDSNFFDAILMKIDIHSAQNNSEADAMAQSLIRKVEREFPSLPKSAQDELNLFKAYLADDKISSYQYYYKIYDRDPKDLYKNTSLAVLTLEGLNDVRATISILNEIPEQSISLDDPFYKQTRLALLARAQIKEENYRKAIRTLDKISKVDTVDRTIFITKLKAMAKLGDEEGIDQFFRDLDVGKMDRDYRYLYYSVAREFDVLGKQDLVNKYANIAIELYAQGDKPNRSMLSRCKYLKKEFDDIVEYYSRNERTANQAYLGGIYAQSGQREEAMAVIEQLKSKPDQGRESYEIGRIYALLGDKDEAIEFLMKSLQGDRWFTLFNFDNDPDLKSLFQDDRFQEVLRYYTDQIEPS